MPLDAPLQTSLIDDILLLARYSAQASTLSGRPSAEAADAAARRVFAVHNNGGLPRALIGHAADRLESRLVEFLRQEAQVIE